MDLKTTLKAIKLNESTITTAIGGIVVLIALILLINYFRSKPFDNITNTGQASSTDTVAKEESYTVKEGDSLWTIAESKYESGYNWVDIAKANNLADANLINEGMTLTMPKAEELTKAPKDTVNLAQAPPKDSINTETYTVVEGDNLWEISVRAYGDGYQWTKVWEANKSLILNPDLIYPEQNLALPR